MPHAWFWWLVEDSEDKHDKLAVQLELFGSLFSWGVANSSIQRHALSGPKQNCVKAHLCDSDIGPCSRWVHPRKKKKMEREQKKKKLRRRNSPWYSLKFSSRATPLLTLVFFPSLSLSLFLFPPSVPTAIVSPCCLPARLPGLSMIILMNS